LPDGEDHADPETPFRLGLDMHDRPMNVGDSPHDRQAEAMAVAPTYSLRRAPAKRFHEPHHIV
jgi:hypothetical protein